MNTNPEIDLEAGGGHLHLNPSPFLNPAAPTSSTPKSSSSPQPTYFQNLVQASITGDEPKLAHGYLSFNVLHKLVLLNHQHKLSLHVRDLVRDKTSTDEQIAQIDQDLHRYRRSMEDYLAWRAKDQSFLLTALADAKRTSSRGGGIQDGVIDLPELSEPHLKLIPELKEVFALAPELRGPCDVYIKAQRHAVAFSSPIGRPRFIALREIGGSWSRSNASVDLRNRFAVAIAGGLSLIAPMLIMVLWEDRAGKVALVTVSVSVLLFAIAMAAWPLVFRALPWVRRWRAAGGEEGELGFGAKEVLFVTAAYAAVLVVFVGTSST